MVYRMRQGLGDLTRKIERGEQNSEGIWLYGYRAVCDEYDFKARIQIRLYSG